MLYRRVDLGHNTHCLVKVLSFVTSLSPKQLVRCSLPNNCNLDNHKDAIMSSYFHTSVILFTIWNDSMVSGAILGEKSCMLFRADIFANLMRALYFVFRFLECVKTFVFTVLKLRGRSKITVGFRFTHFTFSDLADAFIQSSYYKLQ